MPPIGCDATVPVGWSSRHGCSPLGYCLTGYADTHGKPASRWHNPLGAHPMVAATMWDRYRQAVAGRIAA